MKSCYQSPAYFTTATGSPNNCNQKLPLSVKPGPKSKFCSCTFYITNVGDIFSDPKFDPNDPKYNNYAVSFAAMKEYFQREFEDGYEGSVTILSGKTFVMQPGSSGTIGGSLTSQPGSVLNLENGTVTGPTLTFDQITNQEKSIVSAATLWEFPRGFIQAGAVNTGVNDNGTINLNDTFKANRDYRLTFTSNVSFSVGVKDPGETTVSSYVSAEYSFFGNGFTDIGVVPVPRYVYTTDQTLINDTRDVSFSADLVVRGGPTVSGPYSALVVFKVGNVGTVTTGSAIVVPTAALAFANETTVAVYDIGANQTL